MDAGKLAFAFQMMTAQVFAWVRGDNHVRLIPDLGRMPIHIILNLFSLECDTFDAFKNRPPQLQVNSFLDNYRYLLIIRLYISLKLFIK